MIVEVQLRSMVLQLKWEEMGVEERVMMTTIMTRYLIWTEFSPGQIFDFFGLCRRSFRSFDDLHPPGD